MSTSPDALLKTYREKRDFSRTKEPAGTEASGAARGSLFFCVQKHNATRLHYDFRLEWEGVLKSWAVTKGPSLDPADKRLAVRTEDHPLAYGTFEGTIPQDAYGGGTVMLWDQGSWEPRNDPAEGFAKGSLKIRLSGARMRGDWALVRMKPKGRETRENWLLIKEKDDEVDRRRNLLKDTRSVASGRTMRQIAKGGEALEDADLRAEEAHRRAEEAQPDARKVATFARSKTKSSAFVEPQLATLVETAPDGDEWLHEMKYDGYRVVIVLADGRATCFTRNGKDWTERFAPIARAAEALECRNAVLDGEIVAFNDDGRTDFSALQAALSEETGNLSYFLFDCMAVETKSVRDKPLVERKAMLEKLLGSSRGPLHYSQHVTGNGPAVHRKICAAGHEGIVSKRADARYRSGRSKAWQKVKCTRRQEFVIGGYSPSDKARRPLSSILVGVPEGTRLAYRGRVGTGFDQDSLEDLASRFRKLGRKTSPFVALPPSIAREARFVTPALVAEIDFAELTSGGQIRHGVFKGIRQDKEASQVVDEKPSSARIRDDRPDSDAQAQDDAVVAGVSLSHPERVLFPEHGVTKRQLAEYYSAVGERMIALAGNRPLSLVRCPAGRGGQCFFQKHAGEGFPDAIGSVELREKDGSAAHYLTVSDSAGLVAAVQMGTLEFHIWGARNDSLEKPDRLVFDLDPGDGVDFETVRAAAFELRDGLAELGLEAFALATGGKGLHVIAPLQRRQEWGDVKGFAKGFASRLARDHPDRFVATMSKAKRKGRIFIDWLRNERGQTAIAPFSTRARSGAPVATPVSWSELEDLKAANTFSLAEASERARTGKAWKGYDEVRQSITKAMLNAVS